MTTSPTLRKHKARKSPASHTDPRRELPAKAGPGRRAAKRIAPSLFPLDTPPEHPIRADATDDRCPAGAGAPPLPQGARADGSTETVVARGIARLAASSPLADRRRGAEYFLLPVRSLLNRCDSSRVPFEWTINPYRGCEFACRYCYARYTHEFMDLSVEDFEKKIFAKEAAGETLARDLDAHFPERPLPLFDSQISNLRCEESPSHISNFKSPESASPAATESNSQFSNLRCEESPSQISNLKSPDAPSAIPNLPCGAPAPATTVTTAETTGETTAEPNSQISNLKSPESASPAATESNSQFSNLRCEESPSQISNFKSPDAPSVIPNLPCDAPAPAATTPSKPEHIAPSANATPATSAAPGANASRAASIAPRANFSPERHIAIGTATDPYQPAETRFRSTRAILAELAKRRNLSVSITTKSNRILEDLDLLIAIASRNDLAINITVTTVDPELARLLEPRAPHPGLRLGAVRRLAELALPVGVFAMPILPGITDSEPQLDALARAARKAGAKWLGAQAVFLSESSLKVFLPFVEKEFPRVAAEYRRWFRDGMYAPQTYREDLAARIAQLRARHRLASRPYVSAP